MKDKNKKIMINIGCGPLGHDEWTNIDYGILAFAHRFKWLEKVIFKLNLWPRGENINNITYNVSWPKNLKLINARKKMPFAENSVDYIFTSHFLEHIKKYETLRFFKNAHCCLKVGGILRISVPNLDFIVQQYINYSDTLKKVDIINDHFFATIQQEITPPNLFEKIQSFFVRGHQWMYNFEYLKNLLVIAGFKPDSIIKCKPREGKTPNLDMLDCHENESIFLEATK